MWKKESEPREENGWQITAIVRAGNINKTSERGKNNATNRKDGYSNKMEKRAENLLQWLPLGFPSLLRQLRSCD
ncbi:hypothetical protein HPP92_025951 [Vanilla planifolia]|uniref:Uncharacterized protein n=1 Tax=Vanilla planifolia TaxID=51239 RepID=A0A835PKJ9_VANPL|nr:hypothetical protein HPP92_025951 [Vanilla planifolia]